MASFFADIIAPSASEKASRAISRAERCDCPGSRSLTRYAFSAKRAASRNSGTEWRSQIARTRRRFSKETGWPPPVLSVSVIRQSGTLPERW